MNNTSIGIKVGQYNTCIKNASFARLWKHREEKTKMEFGGKMWRRFCAAKVSLCLLNKIL